VLFPNLFNKLFKPKTREITLEELSVYWMDKPVQRTEPVNPVKQNSVDKAGINPPQGSEQLWKHAEINDFFTSYIMSHARIIENAALSAIKEILSILDESGGDCPSIVSGDEETPSQYHALTSTLREHSLDISREAYDIIKKNDRFLLMGKILIAALGHDLGKISGKDGGTAVIAIHAHKSAKMLEPIIKNIQYKDNILAAVQSHHLPKSELKRMEDDTVFILRQADWEARKKELDHLSVSYKPAEPEKTVDKVKTETFAESEPMSWLNLNSLTRIVKPHINMNGIGSVFSLKDTVYVCTGWLKDVIAKEAENNGDKETASRCSDPGDQEIIDLIAEKLKSRALEYRVHFKDPERKPVDIQCYAFKSDLFGNPDEIESRRKESGTLKTIKSIK